MVQADETERHVRRFRSVAEKRRIVELTLEPGASVALVVNQLIDVFIGSALPGRVGIGEVDLDAGLLRQLLMLGHLLAAVVW